MSDETVWRLKIGTVASVLLGIMALAYSGMSIWVNNISLKVASHSEEIATLKECQRNTAGTLTRMEAMLDEIRKDQVRRARKD